MEGGKEPLRGQRLVQSPHGGNDPKSVEKPLIVCVTLDNQGKETGRFGPLKITNTYQQLYWKDLPTQRDVNDLRFGKCTYTHGFV